MAKQWNGYLGGFNGTLGPAIGYLWNGRWCMRSKPAHVRNPRTEQQVLNRTRFAAAVQQAARMRVAVMMGLRTMARENGLTAYNLFCHLNQHCFSVVEGVVEVDYDQLVFATGPVAPVGFGAARVSEENVLTVPYERNPTRGRADAMDEVHIYVYAPRLGVDFMLAPAYRLDKQASALLPDQFLGEELVVYGWVEDAQGRTSDSVSQRVGGQVGEIESQSVGEIESQSVGEIESQSVGESESQSVDEDTDVLSVNGLTDECEASVAAALLPIRSSEPGYD